MIPKEGQIRSAGEKMTANLLKEFGEDVGLLETPNVPDIDKVKVCSMTRKLYGDILKFPKHESVPLLRYLLAQEQAPHQ